MIPMIASVATTSVASDRQCKLATACASDRQERRHHQQQQRLPPTPLARLPANAKKGDFAKKRDFFFFSYFSRDRPKPLEARLFLGILPKRVGDQKDNLTLFLGSWNRYFYCCILGEVPTSLFSTSQVGSWLLQKVS